MMKKLSCIIPTITMILLSVFVKAQSIDLNKYKLMFQGKQITFSQLDSLAKVYPSFSLQKDESTNPPILTVIPLTLDSLNSMKSKEDSVAASWRGKNLPIFTAKDINGKKISSDNLKGKIVVINLYFTHCSPCLREIPELNKLTEEYKGKEIVFIALAPDKKSEVLAFLKKHPFKYIQISDAEKLQKKTFQVQSWPTHIIADSNGIICYYNQGYKETTISEIKESLSGLLK